MVSPLRLAESLPTQYLTHALYTVRDTHLSDTLMGYVAAAVVYTQIPMC